MMAKPIRALELHDPNNYLVFNNIQQWRLSFFIPVIVKYMEKTLYNLITKYFDAKNKVPCENSDE